MEVIPPEPSPADSGYSALTPMVLGLGNDVDHLVEIVLYLSNSVQAALAQLNHLHDRLNNIYQETTILVTGIAEGVGTLSQDFSRLANDLCILWDQQQEVVSAVHELGSISLRYFFNLPVTSGKQTRRSFCSMSSKYKNEKTLRDAYLVGWHTTV